MYFYNCAAPRCDVTTEINRDRGDLTGMQFELLAKGWHEEPPRDWYCPKHPKSGS